MSIPNYHNTDILTSKDFYVNADFQKLAVIKPEDYLWTPSAIPGVEEIMLDRIDHGMVRTTAVAHYFANGESPSPIHRGSQEIFILDGSFANEHSEYVAGTYVRKPMGIATSPKVGANGTAMFIKTHHISKNDTQRTVINGMASWSRTRASGDALAGI